MHNKRRFALYVSLISLVATFVSAQRYAVTDLGALSPTAINTWGQIAGTLDGQAYIWSPFQGLRNLGTLPGGTSSSAAAINDLGVVAGMADGQGTVVAVDGLVTQPCSDLVQAFVWTREKGMRGLGALGVGGDDGSSQWCFGPFSYANSINLLGQVAGNNDWAINTYLNGFLWTKAAGMTLVPFPMENDLVYYNDRADAINDSGQYVGAIGCCTVLASGHAALWTKSGVTDLGTLGGADPDYLFCSEAGDINDAGQIVGWSSFSPDNEGSSACVDGIPIHAVLLTHGGTMQDLGTLPGDTSSQAYKINLFGQVIGISGDTLNWVYPPGRGMVTGRPFIWTSQSGMRDLNGLIRPGSGWVLNTATDINIWGQIVGSGTLNGESHGFLLTPREL